MAEETRYVTAVEYKAEDKASPALNQTAKAADRAGVATGKMQAKMVQASSGLANAAKSALRTTAAFAGIGGAAAGIAMVWREITSFETQTKTLAGVIAQTFDFDSEMSMLERFRVSLDESRQTMERFDASGTAMGHSLETMTKTFSILGAATAGLGLSKTQLEDLTEQTVALATAFGDVPAQAAEVVSTALVTGTLSPTGAVGKRLSGLFTAMEMKAFKDNRAAFITELQKRTAGVREMAIEMNNTLSGSVFKLMDSLADAARLVVQPAANSLKDVIGDWAKSVSAWIKTEQATRWADRVRDVFKDVRDATGWIVSHWKEIAAVWVGMKAASAAAGLGAAAGGLSGVAGKLGTLGQKAGTAAAGLALVYLGAQAFADWVDKQQGKAIKRAGEAGAFIPAAFRAAQAASTARSEKVIQEQARIMAGQLRQMGAIQGGQLQRGAFAQAIRAMSAEAYSAMRRQMGIPTLRGRTAVEKTVAAMVDKMDAMVGGLARLAPEVSKQQLREAIH